MDFRPSPGTVICRVPPSEVRIQLPERYRVVRHVANGGMASVWAAEDSILGRLVAVKVLAQHVAADPSARTRFEREARTAARVSDHPNVATIYDVGEHDDVPFIVMELFTGGSVADRLRAGAHDPAHPRARLARAGRRRAGLRARRGHRPPRHQAGEPPARRARPPRRRRLRHRPRRRGLVAHPGRPGARHRRLPVARAGARQARHRRQRPLLAGRRRLRAAHRPPALPGRARRRPGPPARRGRHPHLATSGPRSTRCSSARMAKDPDERYPTAARFVEELRAVTTGAAAGPPTPPPTEPTRRVTRRAAAAAAPRRARPARPTPPPRPWPPRRGRRRLAPRPACSCSPRCSSSRSPAAPSRCSPAAAATRRRAGGQQAQTRSRRASSSSRRSSRAAGGAARPPRRGDRARQRARDRRRPGQRDGENPAALNDEGYALLQNGHAEQARPAARALGRGLRGPGRRGRPDHLRLRALQPRHGARAGRPPRRGDPVLRAPARGQPGRPPRGRQEGHQGGREAGRKTGLRVTVEGDWPRRARPLKSLRSSAE